MSIKSELEALKTKDGLYQPDRIVKWAAVHKRSRLHAALEWDNAKAGNEYRLWQVRHLIQLHIRQEDRTPQVVSLTIDRHQSGGYRELADVARVPELREVLLRDAINELLRVYQKYSYFVELSGVGKELTLLRGRFYGPDEKLTAAE